MKVYLYSFESTIDSTHFTNDNIDHTVSGVTYYASAIESKEVILDLKEIMGEVTMTLPWDQAGFLKDCIAYPYDAAVEANVYIYDTVYMFPPTLVFKGFLNSVKASQCQLELSCVSFVEQARDNFPRMYITRICNHRLYSDLCTVDPASWTTTGTIMGLSRNRQGFYIGNIGSFAENWFRFGYVKLGTPHRWITYNSALQTIYFGGVTANMMLFNVIHPLPPSWVVGTSVELVAGCDKRMSTCAEKFSNFEHYLGFPHAPYETIRLTGLKSTEVYTREGGGKKK